MKKLIFLIIFIPYFVYGQSEEYIYTYDDAGNRIFRQVVTSKKAEPNTQQVSEYTIEVFPNPVNEILNIDIAGLKNDSKVKVEFIDMSGNTLYINENTSSNLKMDMSDKPNGAYFLNIYIDNKRSYWKIIKED